MAFNIWSYLLSVTKKHIMMLPLVMTNIYSTSLILMMNLTYTYECLESRVILIFICVYAWCVIKIYSFFKFVSFYPCWISNIVFLKLSQRLSQVHHQSCLCLVGTLDVLIFDISVFLFSTLLNFRYLSLLDIRPFLKPQSETVPSSSSIMFTLGA